MEYRRFGRTELAMPVFSCGGMRYQQSWQDQPLVDITTENQLNLESTIRRAMELGINHIETARGYGTSEIQLGQVLPRLPRQSLILQTKVSPREDPVEFEQTLELSFAKLGVDYIDLFGLHGINNEELLNFCLRPGGCLEIAQRFQSQGRIRFIGFSTHAPTQLILQAIHTNQFDYVNLHWYYFNQTNWSAIEAASQKDMGVFIISPSDKGGRLYEPSQRLRELCSPLSPMVFNDLFCLSHPQVHTLSLGAARVGDFEEHLKTIPLLSGSLNILSEIQERLQSAAIARFSQRFGDTPLANSWFYHWADGLPRWQDTPGNINIPVMLWLWNLLIAYDMVEFGRNRYNLFDNGGHWFPGNRLPQVHDFDFSDCLVNSPYQHLIPELLIETHQLLSGEGVHRLSHP